MITKSIATSHDAINLNIINRVPRKIGSFTIKICLRWKTSDYNVTINHYTIFYNYTDKRDDHDGGVVDSKPAEELKPEEKENPLKYIITITYFLRKI